MSCALRFIGSAQSYLALVCVASARKGSERQTAAARRAMSIIADMGSIACNSHVLKTGRCECEMEDGRCRMEDAGWRVEGGGWRMQGNVWLR